MRSLSVFAIAIATIALTGCSLFGITGTGAGADDAAGIATDVFTLKVGDCLNDGTTAGEVSEVRLIDCENEHESEAYESVMLPDAGFPGEAAIDKVAIDRCKSAFSAFVGIEYDDSALDFTYYFPTESSWSEGDREVLCLVTDPVGKSKGSLAGVAR